MSAGEIAELVEHAERSSGGLVLGQPFSARAGARELAEARQQVANCLSALANHPKGGVLLLGVEPSPLRALGVGDAQAAWAQVQALCAEMEPPLTVHPAELHHIAGRPILALGVRPVKSGSCYHRPRGLGGGRFRIEDGGVRLWPLGSEEWGELPDRRVLERLWSDRLDEAAMKRLAERSAVVPTGKEWDGPEWRRKMVTLGVLAKGSGGSLWPTVAGALCFAKELEGALPGAAVLVHSGGQERRLTGSIPTLLAEVTRCIPPVSLLEAPVLQELVLNALAHRDWSAEKVPVQVRFGSTWVEVINPGEPLEAELLVDNPQRRCAVRNPTLLDLLWRLRLCSAKGEGLGRVRVWLKEEGGALVVEARGGETRVKLEELGLVFHATRQPQNRLVGALSSVSVVAPAPEDDDEATPAEMPGAGEGRESALVALFQARGRLTTREVTEALGWPRSTTRALLARLVESGQVRCTAGSSRSPHQAYELSEG